METSRSSPSQHYMNSSFHEETPRPPVPYPLGSRFTSANVSNPPPTLPITSDQPSMTRDAKLAGNSFSSNSNPVNSDLRRGRPPTTQADNLLHLLQGNSRPPSSHFRPPFDHPHPFPTHQYPRSNDMAADLLQPFIRPPSNLTELDDQRDPPFIPHYAPQMPLNIGRSLSQDFEIIHAPGRPPFAGFHYDGSQLQINPQGSFPRTHGFGPTSQPIQREYLDMHGLHLDPRTHGHSGDPIQYRDYPAFQNDFTGPRAS
jgi:hypothetical protein